LSALTQSMGRLKSALAAVLICAPSLAVCLNQAAAAEPSIAVAELPQDLSPWGMFLHADQIVKAVMIGLAVASLVTWTVWVAKSIELFGARKAVRRGLRVLAGSTTLAQAREKLSSGRAPVAQRMQAAANEIRSPRSDASGKTPAVDAATASSTASAHPEDRAERRQVTVMFSDLVGSTALSSRMDPGATSWISCSGCGALALESMRLRSARTR
jgi:hypothetical protein